jgi:DNA-directed RNA polymerase subunit RPC12/RpoP
MEALFKCQCGATERDNENQRPFRCETCPECGSQILAEGEVYDEPLAHVPIEHDGKTICKRCRKDL